MFSVYGSSSDKKEKVNGGRIGQLLFRGVVYLRLVNKTGNLLFNVILK